LLVQTAISCNVSSINDFFGKEFAYRIGSGRPFEFLPPAMTGSIPFQLQTKTARRGPNKSSEPPTQSQDQGYLRLDNFPKNR
jgi:hypothetical protein